ncbi:MAG: MBL fold metallo-hydrolase [Tyzzerella sp.]|nr:MBL fold metallo-hydrolase [Tyzzerella sp.]
MVKFKKIMNDIYRLETPVEGVWNGIIFIDGKEKILIDSGLDAKNIDECLVPALKQLGYQLSDMDWLLNTHCHGDHVGGHRRIVELGNVKVAVYRKSVDKLHNPLKYSKLIRATFPEHSPAAPAVLEGVKETSILEEGDIVAGRLQLIATPGHDDDCVCFYDLETKSLITGDSLQGNGTASQGTALYMSLTDYQESLSKLRTMDIQNIISGHPYLFSGDKAIGEEEAITYLKNCERIVEIYGKFIAERLDDGETEIAAIAEQLISHMNNIKPGYLFLPMYTVKTHIEEIKITRNRQKGR